MGERDERHDVLMENWRPLPDSEMGDVVICDEGGHEFITSHGATTRTCRIRAEFVEAATELARGLLIAEWYDYEGRPTCTACDDYGHEYRHGGGCPIDLALTKAGFPDQESRNAAREHIKRDRLARGKSLAEKLWDYAARTYGV